jgi:hypothetical protein
MGLQRGMHEPSMTTSTSTTLNNKTSTSNINADRRRPSPKVNSSKPKGFGAPKPSTSAGSSKSPSQPSGPLSLSKLFRRLAGAGQPGNAGQGPSAGNSNGHGISTSLGSAGGAASKSAPLFPIQPNLPGALPDLLAAERLPQALQQVMQVGSSAGTASTSAAVYGSSHLNNIVTLSTSGVPAVASGNADRLGISSSRSIQAGTNTAQQEQQQHMVEDAGSQEGRMTPPTSDASTHQDPMVGGTAAHLPRSHPLVDATGSSREGSSPAQQQPSADPSPESGTEQQHPMQGA